MVENLTENALVYALVGTTLRVYSWTILSVVSYLLFRSLKMNFKINKVKSKLYYLYLFIIPFSLFNVVTYSINLGENQGILLADIAVLMFGLMFLISSLIFYKFLKKRGDNA